MRDYGVVEYKGEKWAYDKDTNYVQKLLCYLEGNNCLNCINNTLNNCNIERVKKWLNDNFKNEDNN